MPDLIFEKVHCGNRLHSFSLCRWKRYVNLTWHVTYMWGSLSSVSIEESLQQLEGHQGTSIHNVLWALSCPSLMNVKCGAFFKSRSFWSLFHVVLQ